jgi:hypothetical protein
MVSAKNILEKGSVEVRIKSSGMFKRIMLKVVKEKTAWGVVPFLVSSYQVPATELVRLAEELQLPIKCNDMKVFPKGKAAADFAQAKAEKPKGLAHSRIVAEKKEENEDEGEQKEPEQTADEETKEEGHEEEAQVEPEENEDKEIEEHGVDEPEKVEEKTEEQSEPEEESVEPGEKEASIIPDNQVIELENPDQKQKPDEEKTQPEEKKKKTFASEVLSEGILI